MIIADPAQELLRFLDLLPWQRRGHGLEVLQYLGYFGVDCAPILDGDADIRQHALQAGFDLGQPLGRRLFVDPDMHQQFGKDRRICFLAIAGGGVA